MDQDASTPTLPTAPDIASQLRPVLGQLAAVLDGSTTTDPAAATPCSDYDVAALREHVVQWLTAFAAGYAAPDGKAPEATAVVTHPAAQASSASETLLQAVADGAAQRPLDLGGQAMPGDMALSMILWEYQVHGWDLAVATGQAWTPDDAGLELSLAFAPGMLTPDFQGEGKSFAPRVETRDDTNALDRLVALSGREPGWQPGS